MAGGLELYNLFHVSVKVLIEYCNYLCYHKCVLSRFRQFQPNDRLWKEIKMLIAALRSEHPDENQVFLINMFNHLPPGIVKCLGLFLLDT